MFVLCFCFPTLSGPPCSSAKASAHADVGPWQVFSQKTCQSP